MMTKAAILAWLVALPYILDRGGHPIRRPVTVSIAIATAAAETDYPLFWASLIDEFAALEASYRPDAVGDHGRSCGLAQTACNVTPKDALGQVRLAIATHQRSSAACPAHPLSIYGTGACRVWTEGDRRLAFALARLSIPVPDQDYADRDGVPEVVDVFPTGPAHVILAAEAHP